MANRHMKRSSASLPPGRCKSKPPRDSASHLSERLLLRRQEITSAVEDVKGKEPHHCGWECKRTQPLWETVWGSSRNKTKHRTSLDSDILFLGIYPKGKNAHTIPERHMHL